VFDNPLPWVSEAVTVVVGSETAPSSTVSSSIAQQCVCKFGRRVSTNHGIAAAIAVLVGAHIVAAEKHPLDR
jgi:hypothetical protein